MNDGEMKRPKKKRKRVRKRKRKSMHGHELKNQRKNSAHMISQYETIKSDIYLS